MLPSYYNFPVFSGKRVLFGVTGSVAAYKTLDLIRALNKQFIACDVCLTSSAERFITPLLFSSIGAETVYTKLFDDNYNNFAHLEPSQMADAFVIAPATANILAKIAHGIADDMLSTQALAWQGEIIFAPAMNPKMWENSATKTNIKILQDRGHKIVYPQTGTVACGETGTGKLANPLEIYIEILKTLAPKDLINKKILITLGPTREFFDPARFCSNPSSGKMGAAIAIAAYLRGAEVFVVNGPCHIHLPAEIYTNSVISADEMVVACQDIWPSMDFGIFAAAVADFKPPYKTLKIKKNTTKSKTIEFSKNPDILSLISKDKTKFQKLIGFAAETHDLEIYASEKLQSKNLDLIIANNISNNRAFATNKNEVFVLDKSGRQENWPLLAKSEIAWRIIDWIKEL